MSIYAVNKLCRDALHDLAFRAALKRDRARRSRRSPLTDASARRCSRATSPGSTSAARIRFCWPISRAGSCSASPCRSTASGYERRGNPSTGSKPPMDRIRSVPPVPLSRHRRSPAGHLAERRQGGGLGHPQYRALPLGDRQRGAGCPQSFASRLRQSRRHLAADRGDGEERSARHGRAQRGGGKILSPHHGGVRAAEMGADGSRPDQLGHAQRSVQGPGNGDHRANRRRSSRVSARRCAAGSGRASPRRSRPSICCAITASNMSATGSTTICPTA